MDSRQQTRLILLFRDENTMQQFVAEHYRVLRPQRVLGPEPEMQIPTTRTYRLANPRKEYPHND